MSGFPSRASFTLGPTCALTSNTRGRSRMPKSGESGSVRGAASNGRPYRDTPSKPRKGRCAGRPGDPFRGRLTRLGEKSEEDTQLLHRGSGGSMYTRKAHATREAPMRDQG